MTKRKPKDKPKPKCVATQKTIRFHDFFSPSEAINGNNSRLFVGRETLVLDAISDLARPSSTVIVYGERGGGKTSFARIVMHRACERNSTKNPISDAREIRFVWQKVSPGVETLEDVLYRIMDPWLLGSESLARQFPGVTELIEEDYRKLDPIKVMESSLGTTERILNPHQKLVYSLFERVEQFILSNFPTSQPVIAIDELDQLGDLDGLGRLIKNSSLNFLLVGIANNVEEIVADHKSAQRKITKEYRIPRLDRQEVGRLFGIAEEIATELGVRLKFTDSFSDEVFADSAGIPGRCQKLGAAVVERFSPNLMNGEDISVSKEDYINLLARKDNPYIHDSISSNLIDNCLSRGTSRWQILKALGKKEPDGSKVGGLDDFKPAIRHNLKTWLEELAVDKVIIFDKTKTKIAFADADLWGEVRRRIRIQWEPNG